MEKKNTFIYRKILAEDFLKLKFQTIYTRYPTNPRQVKYKENHTFAHYCESVENHPITSWQIDEETMETVTDFIFGGLQSHCRWCLQP